MNSYVTDILLNNTVYTNKETIALLKYISICDLKTCTTFSRSFKAKNIVLFITHELPSRLFKPNA